MLSQTAIYALRIIGYVAAQKGRRVSGSEISTQMKIPRNFLSKISHTLSRSGLLDATRGVNGGFVLARPAASISLADVAALFMNLGDLDRCFLGLDDLDGECCMHQEWALLMAHVRKFLATRTVDQILDHGADCGLSIEPASTSSQGETQ